jgi:site-specific recombinase XerD
LTAKHRRLADGSIEDYLACDSLQAHVTGLYRAAGLQECSGHSGRRTFATRLMEQGHDIEVIQRLLGHAEIDHSDAYLDVNRDTLRAMFTGAI